ncbi:gamma-glutamyl-gamma-aminobutyrate hydrolase family protein [Hwanghaeella sp.]|uniref:gamma-glutamyl-gamma-aminobutyrate hydrolase family protein n=1 Tax=Hwanghaeella sp. TaxID=2605943 RepID=UPI003CCC2E8B
MRRPVIGVTGGRRRGRISWLCAALSLRLHGARAVRITAPRTPHARFDPAVVAGLDGLVIGGGDDIGATLYGAEPVPDVWIDPARDALELAALETLWRTEIPILGICRGSQMLNIFAGGNLHQDIYTAFEEVPRIHTPLPRKHVTLEPGTRLESIIGKGTVTVNALHHQSVDRLGDGFAVAARDEFGIVQATEHQGEAFRVGVQWHPEFLFYRRAHRRLFGALVGAARDYAARG